MVNLNNYQQCEIKGRKKFADFLKKTNSNVELEFTKEETDKLDAVFTSSTLSVYGVEIKDRNEKYENYETYLFEKTKFDEMCERQKKKETDECWYVCFFGKHLYIFKWSDINSLINENKVHIINRWLPKKTVEDNGMRKKPCYELPKMYAYQYNYDELSDKWKLTNKPFKN